MANKKPRLLEIRPDDNRVTVTSGTDIERMVDATIEALADESMFQRGGTLVDVVRDATVANHRLGIDRPEGTPRIRLLPEARLKELCARAVRYVDVRPDKDGKATERPIAPPRDVVKAVLARGEWRRIRPLAGVVSCPIMRPDGTVLNSRGYDEATGFLFEPNVEVEVLEFPTREDAQRALKSLYAVVGDFPFRDNRHRAAWVSTLLSLLARPAIDGPVPLLLIDASTRGSGKTKLADVISVIATGNMVPRRPMPTKREEWAKAMLGIGIAGDAMILFDNVTTLVRGDALDMVLTGTTFRDRLLGKNEEFTVEMRTVFVVSANNAQVSTDLVRRSLHVRLEPEVEHPEARDDFEHADLVGWVQQKRARLVADGLTILRAYQLVDERPELTPAGSFERWSEVVREAIVWAGGSDPIETQADLEAAADPDTDALREMLTGWHALHGDATVTARDVLESCAPSESERLSEAAGALRDAVLQLVPSDKNGNPSSKAFAHRLAKHKDRIVSGLVLRRVDVDSNRGAQWFVTEAGRPTG